MISVVSEIFGLVLAVLLLEDAANIGAGLAVANGDMPLGVALAGCFLGLLCGDSIYFGLGRWIGRPATTYAPLRWILTEEHLNRCTRFFEKHGPKTIIASRFLPGFRSAGPFVAGLSKITVRRSMLYFIAAAAIYSPLPVFAAMLLGRVVKDYLISYRHYGYGVAIAILIVGWLLLRCARSLNRNQHRRQEPSVRCSDTLP